MNPTFTFRGSYDVVGNNLGGRLSQGRVHGVTGVADYSHPFSGYSAIQ